MTPEWDTKDQLREYAAAGRLPIPLEAALELVDRGCTRASGTQVIAPMLLTPTPSTDPASPNYVPGAVFDVDRVERTCKALAGLRHTKGRRWANQPLVPEPWQLFWYIAPVWGWIGADTFRIIRTAWLEVGRKNGKALALDTPLPTPAGWTTMGEVMSGDQLLAEDGRPCTVVAATEVMHDRQCYRVTFQDGTSFVADAEHQWMVSDRGQHRTHIRTTEEMAGDYRIGNRETHQERRYAVPVADPLQLPERELLVDPYVLGAWLGDGHSACGRITMADPEVIGRIKAAGYRTKNTHDITHTVYGLMVQLRELGVLGAKHIPAVYLRASVDQRLALLQGLMDTDGFVSPKGQAEFCSISRRLAHQVLELVSTLGYRATVREGRATINGRDCGAKYRVLFYPDQRLPVVHLERKAARLRPVVSGRSRNRYVVGIEKVESVPVRCVEVDSPSHQYLAGPTMIATHNSTMASGLMIVLLVADGELGAEVYSAAASTDQARQVFEPAKAMMVRAPLLAGKFKALADVIRVPQTGSIFRVLSRVADTAHGLNVSGAVVDEVHVHKSRDLIDALDTGEGARDQPLILYITTSDDGTVGTIYDEKHGEVESLASGIAVPDYGLYGAVWAVPEGEDPFLLENVKLANPNVGVSISEEYLEKKAARAMRTPSFMPTYERLHCNRRRKAEVRAISMEQWDAGAEPAMGMEELREYLSGRDCYGGLDLSSTEDFSAWAMVFPDTFQVEGVEMEGVWVLPRLWIPRAAVDRHKSIRSSIDWWASQGWVTVTDGSVIDYDQLEAEIGEDATRHNVVEFAYDPWQAEALRQRLTSGGLIGWKCGQTMERMAPATHELDRLLGLTLIRHGGNPALAWMASNVVAKRDSAGRWKPEKQLSAEKIDGIVAVIMGVGAWRRPDRVAKPTKVATASGDVGDMPLTSGDDFFRSSGRLDI